MSARDALERPLAADQRAEVLRNLRLKIAGRHVFDEDDAAAIGGCVTGIIGWPADHRLIRQGDRLEQSTLLLDGVLARAKTIDGGRQIMELHVPGDLADLHSFLLKRLDSDIVALTPVRVATLAHTGLERVLEERPHLARVLWFLTCVDAAISREWEVSLGRRPAKARLAHLLCELHARLGAVERADPDGFDLALTQVQIGHCLGLTPVHVNRVAGQLRTDGVALLRRGRVDVLDHAALARIGQWTPDYLYFDAPRFG